MRHFLHLLDLTGEQISELLTEAIRFKAARARRALPKPLADRVIALVFEKPSLRTRVSFESAILQLGGSSLYLAGADVGLGWRESNADIARTLNQFVDAVVLRVFKQSTLDELARWSSIPIVNGLSDLEHPCQALADVMTIVELFGTVAGKTVTFVGDGNNVSRSLAVAVGKLGGTFILSAPAGYGFDAEFTQWYATNIGNPLSEISDPTAAVAHADVIYTDVWTSMGQEAEREKRLKDFTGYQVNESLLAKAPSHTKVLHCLPAHRDEEITDGVMESPASVVFQQAGNRMYAQMAVLAKLVS
ncbi:ornithine carbamoyltransferase : Ornithine carbamoyltransferase OS=Rhodopirellula sp. SWK7 GN=RRSWK_05436 PE=3 SV=1: OTCace_N: OTCace [Tuwongella immobilis]|uniref:Ornithine carbamoyltransferase n=2 Tax=Tuwongella immobilis TaxID=692036 RepID=A0A6C2YVE3_9BACT|nr:ornithine carbamoyltransferase : Ornithine carbamoyltransferase OS=Rhodopirellula sp. SWK7 GN=RRSWK_05436 PE=3 SV=1: OTCace_N: OTCace [Tuwongella immobilis]VTS08078.1 ornithine carbamoyltransferase : Ornithine carbamoyltransferase OS=Rhodopirellula sp. SWK7 GN=RRSWK_05436 PE=3 SV=1: OTCace_N: OTCace [Tuwongella immobilis]